MTQACPLRDADPDDERFNSWGRGYMSYESTLESLSPSFVPQWAADGQGIVFGIGDGFTYEDQAPTRPNSLAPIHRKNEWDDELNWQECAPVLLE